MKPSFKRHIPFILICFFTLIKPCSGLEVTLLTPQGSKILKSWTPEMLISFSKGKSEISAQQLLIEDSALNLELKDRANIDLFTLYSESGMARIPRFMAWRGYLNFYYDSKTKTLSSKIKRKAQTQLLVPTEAFEIKNIQKIELAEHSLVYPETKLQVRTNPAASRGEKLFTQTCLACHSLPHHMPLTPANLTVPVLDQFNARHHVFKGLEINARDRRGLIAYSEALAFEKNEVKSKK